jgi:SAM-dependent methyltransferase
MAEPARWKPLYTSAELLDVACPACGCREYRDIAREGGIAVARCAICDLVYTRTPLPAAQAHYTVSKEEFQAKYGPIFRGERPHPRDRNYEEHLDLLGRYRRPGDLLDVGSHCGFFLRRARARGWRAKGVEPSPSTAELARREFGLDVTTGTLQEANFRDGSFDAVTLVDVFEHIGDPQNLLAEVRRVLRPDGVLLIKVPNVRYARLKHRTLGRLRLVSNSFDAHEHLVHYSDRTLARTIEEAGLKVDALAVPAPIQVGGPLRRALRRAGPALAARLPAGVRLPIATDLYAVARRR